MQRKRLNFDLCSIRAPVLLWTGSKNYHKNQSRTHADVYSSSLQEYVTPSEETSTVNGSKHVKMDWNRKERGFRWAGSQALTRRERWDSERQHERLRVEKYVLERCDESYRSHWAHPQIKLCQWVQPSTANKYHRMFRKGKIVHWKTKWLPTSCPLTFTHHHFNHLEIILKRFGL